MTHEVDCSVCPEAREYVNDVAEKYLGRERHEASAMARDAGWTRVGSGVGRDVWEVSTDLQGCGQMTLEGVPDAVREAPCVIKFATGRGIGMAGTEQNRREVEDFQHLPDKLFEGDPPVLVPIADWETDMWLSMPKADASGGSSFRAEERLRELDYECTDLHTKNVGEMHGETVVFDYGGECKEATIDTGAINRFEDELDNMRDLDVVDIEVFETDMTARIYFTMPGWLAGDGDADEDSHVEIGVDGNAHFATVNFGSWNERQSTFIHSAGQQVAQAMNEAWGQLRVSSDVERHDGRVDLAFFVNTVGVGGMQEFIFTKFLGELGRAVDDTVTDFGSREFLEDVADAFEQHHDLRDTDFDFGASFPKFLFAHPDYPDVASKSYVAAGEDGFEFLRISTGPWGAEEHAIGPRAMSVVDATDGLFEEVDIRWKKILRGDMVEISFEASPSTPAALSPGEVEALATDILAAAREHMPETAVPA